MDDKRILYSQMPLLPLSRSAPTGKTTSTVGSAGSSFGQLLDNHLAQVQFSQHAQQRLQSRNINLSPEQITKLAGAVDKVAAKGAREALVLMDNQLAFLVGVKSRTVITAVAGEGMKDSVFTNIDSAVIV